MYILTITAKRKSARRHIVSKYRTLEEARRMFDILNNRRYIIEIYTGNWQFVEQRPE